MRFDFDQWVSARIGSDGGCRGICLKLERHLEIPFLKEPIKCVRVNVVTIRL